MGVRIMPRHNDSGKGEGRSRDGGAAFFKKLDDGEGSVDLGGPTNGSLSDDDGWIGEAPGRNFQPSCKRPSTLHVSKIVETRPPKYGMGFSETIRDATGVVLKYEKMAYGWIRLSDGSLRTVYVHRNGIQCDEGDVPYLWRGMRVTFNVVFSTRFSSWEAVNVRLSNGQAFVEWGKDRGLIIEDGEDSLRPIVVYMRERRPR
jgi:hypothetical protein